MRSRGEKASAVSPDPLERARAVFECGQAVLGELGAGLSEQVLQSALAIEFRQRAIPYLREPHIEIFYRGEAVGLERPDFALWIAASGEEPRPGVLLEVKQADRILADHRQQLLGYLRALPSNRDPRLTGITTGLLLRFPKVDPFDAWEGISPGAIELEVWSRDGATGVITRRAVMPEA